MLRLPEPRPLTDLADPSVEPATACLAAGGRELAGGRATPEQSVSSVGSNQGGLGPTLSFCMVNLGKWEGLGQIPQKGSWTSSFHPKALSPLPPCSRELSSRVSTYSKRLSAEADTLNEEVSTLSKTIGGRGYMGYYDQIKGLLETEACAHMHAPTSHTLFMDTCRPCPG